MGPSRYPRQQSWNDQEQPQHRHDATPQIDAFLQATDRGLPTILQELDSLSRATFCRPIQRVDSEYPKRTTQPGFAGMPKSNGTIVDLPLSSSLLTQRVGACCPVDSEGEMATPNVPILYISEFLLELKIVLQTHFARLLFRERIFLNCCIRAKSLDRREGRFRFHNSDHHT
jgi:hypothetical protein